MSSFRSTTFGAWGRLTVQRARPFDARGDLLTKLFGVAPQPVGLLAEALQLFHSQFIRRDHASV
jgi:hypothetical protein